MNHAPQKTTLLTAQPSPLPVEIPVDPGATQVMAGWPTSLASSQVVGPYAIQRRLGSGAMGEVYLAQETGSECLVALKLVTNVGAVNTDFIHRFERECALLSRLDHPNIAKALRYGTDQGRLYLAMEYVPGTTLAEMIAGGALEQKLAVLLTVQIARGLEYTYDQVGLIHRDVKPGNVLVSNVGTGQEIAKIIDFGLAKDVVANDQNLTMAGMILGTPFYMSPEQIRNQGQLTFSTDLYALGATLYHLLTGQVPYVRSSPADVLSAHLSAPISDPRAICRDLSPGLSAIVQRCLAKTPQARYQSYRAFINDCAKALERLGTSLEPTQRVVLPRWPSPPSVDAERKTDPMAVMSPPVSNAAHASVDGYRPASVITTGSDPLVPTLGQASVSGPPTRVSGALREATSKRYAHLRATHPEPRKPASLSHFLQTNQASEEPLQPRSRAELALAALQWFALVTVMALGLWLVLIVRW